MEELFNNKRSDVTHDTPKQKKKLSAMSILAIIMLLFGLRLTVLGAVTIYEDLNFMKTAVATDAEITDIQLVVFDHDRKRYDVYLKFDVNGQSYNGVIHEHTIWMEPGENVAIYYNSNNPNDFCGKTTLLIGGITLLLSGLAPIAIVGAAIRLKKKF